MTGPVFSAIPDPLILSGSYSASSGTTGPRLSLASVVNNSGAASHTSLSVAPTLTGLGSGTNLLANITGGHANLTGQQRWGYDNSNYLNLLVSSAGVASFTATGSGTEIRLDANLLRFKTGGSNRFQLSGNNFTTDNATGPGLTNGTAVANAVVNPNRSAANAGLGSSTAGNVTTYASNGTGGAAVNVLDAAYDNVAVLGSRLGTAAFSVNGSLRASGGVGVGADPAQNLPLNVVLNYNGVAQLRMDNTNGGTTAAAALTLTNNGSSGSMTVQARGTGSTTSYPLIQNSGNVLAASALTGGLVIGTRGANPISIAINDTEVANFAADGSGFVMASGKSIQLGNAYTAGDPTTTGYVTIKDSTGTTYRIPAMVAP